MLFAKADYLVDKILSEPRLKFSNPLSWILEVVETGILLTGFTQQLRRRNADFPYFYFTLFDAAGISPTLILNQKSQTKKRGSWVSFKSELQTLQRLYTQSGAAYGSVRNIVKASSLPVSKFGEFLHSKPFYTKFNLATRKSKRIKAFDRFKNEICCMDLAYIDKLANYNNNVKYLL